MKAVNSYILINEEDSKSTRESGFVTPDSSRYKKGTVKNVNSTSVIKEGDVIYYDSASGHNISLDGVEYRVITERDVVIIM